LAQFLVVTGQAAIPLDAYRNGVFVIFPYFVAGYALAARHGHLAVGPWVAVVVAVAVGAESLIWYHLAGGSFGVDNMVSLLVGAPLVFLIALRMRGIGRDGKAIASMAAFVYFIHVLVMMLATRLGLDGNAKALFVMLVSVGLAVLLNSFPGGRRLLAALT
ncbi:hypothetical protein, partial [uncultured Paracoccus sp.]|uniref:hypothetical protein n=1 Tax=uncultured Paracoccus sp. TaxID=189685 RepID=UPI0025E6A0B2